MAVKNYGIHDKWTDLDKLNTIDIKSVDGVIESVKINGEEAGGGSSWQTVFEGSVTTVKDGGFNVAPIDTNISANTIKVSINNVVYTCEKLEDNSYGALFNEGADTYDWSEYPFNIYYTGETWTIATETAGTYTLKIEEPQSGGSSDFSTAQVTVTNNASDDTTLVGAVNISNDMLSQDVVVDKDATITVSAVLYKNEAHWMVSNYGVAVTGNATTTTTPFGATGIIITGDCTITIS